MWTAIFIIVLLCAFCYFLLWGMTLGARIYEKGIRTIDVIRKFVRAKEDE